MKNNRMVDMIFKSNPSMFDPAAEGSDVHDIDKDRIFIHMNTGQVWELMSVDYYGSPGFEWSIRSFLPPSLGFGLPEDIAGYDQATMRFRTNDAGFGLFAFNEDNQEWIHLNHNWMSLDILRKGLDSKTIEPRIVAQNVFLYHFKSAVGNPGIGMN